MITRTGVAAAIVSGHDGFLINRVILSFDYICVGFIIARWRGAHNKCFYFDPIIRRTASLPGYLTTECRKPALH